MVLTGTAGLGYRYNESVSVLSEGDRGEMRLTSSLAIDVCNFRGDDRRVQKPLVGNAQPALGLILLALALLPRTRDLLERSRRYRVVLNPISQFIVVFCSD